ncbi:M48 family metalloprotease [Helicobacter sp. 16-1353]|uniref:M48 family metalloprotease n=1 Tax=Helicobacter sp. 16-1353 TaxID=2004996 RepID=UPI0011BEF39C|nr:M48 family metalloprotease [Helicobacter sp. 16-1353]
MLFIATRIILGRETKIKGDFWEHKKLAKSKIAWLGFLFLATLLLIFLTAYGLFMFIIAFIYFDATNELSIRISFAISAFIVIIIIFSYLYKSMEMSKHSINNLAKTLKATEIKKYHKLSPQDQVLLNVVEEMAIASNMSIPRVFVMREELGVNAMCSGENFGRYNEKIAIFVTQGALDTFNRDELQGVIGHEFSHAFHQDVELNIKLFSIVFALTCVMILGETLFRTISSKSRDSSKSMLLILLFTLVCFLLGWIGNIFSQIIQSAISRQKEFLADASSVQYTRNPNGIKDALVKIMNLDRSYQLMTTIKNPNAHPCAHMFFLKPFNSIFDTHPPLDERINRLIQIGAIGK